LAVIADLGGLHKTYIQNKQNKTYTRLATEARSLSNMVKTLLLRNSTRIRDTIMMTSWNLSVSRLTSSLKQLRLCKLVFFCYINFSATKDVHGLIQCILYSEFNVNCRGKNVLCHIQ